MLCSWCFKLYNYKLNQVIELKLSKQNNNTYQIQVNQKYIDCFDIKCLQSKLLQYFTTQHTPYAFLDHSFNLYQLVLMHYSDTFITTYYKTLTNTNTYGDVILLITDFITKIKDHEQNVNLNNQSIKLISSL